ncbi:hypothetical protein, partial [Herbaspirillum sp. ST 5-3]|uniref:hypothetical protein n=1 Tax=Herbaspirillum sp. ST 5-3 TaxID=2567936 RepID=UPI001B3BB19F
GISIEVFLVVILRNTNGPEIQGATSLRRHDVWKEQATARMAYFPLEEEAAQHSRCSNTNCASL